MNEQIIEWIKTLYTEQNGILGYRQMTIAINRNYQTHFNKKRIRRLMRALQLKSVCRKKRKNYTPSTPEITAENILNRKFYADKPNEKWLTDVTEFKWYEGSVVHKLYLSAILDLYDRRIVAYKIGTSNNNKLVFDTLEEAVTKPPQCTSVVSQRPWFPVHEQGLPSKVGCCKNDTEYVQSWKMYRQRSNGGILGNLKIRDVLFEEIYRRTDSDLCH